MRHDEIIRKAREAVERHPLPDFVTRYEIEIGDFDGDPALWVRYKLRPGPMQQTAIEIDRQVIEMNHLVDAVMPDLLQTFEDRFPYFRFETDGALAQ